MSDNSEEIIIRVINYLYLIIVIVGTPANLLAFVVFSRKKFQNTVFSTYFRILLVVDTIGLVYLTLGKFLAFEFGINLRNLHDILCKITMPLAYSIPPISAYITVMISFDRWLTIAKPTVLLIKRNKYFQILICIAIIILNFLYNGQLFFSNFYKDPLDNTSSPRCLIIDVSTLSTMDLINTTVVPFSLMITFTLLTIKAVFHASKIIRQSTLHPRTIGNNKNTRNKDSLKKKDIKFAITSILLSILFLLFTGPFTLYSFLYDYVLDPINGYTWIGTISLLFLTYCNHAVVFFINISLNKQFREELYALFGKKAAKEKNSMTNIDTVNEESPQ
jgi:hypothetical protein